MSINFLTILIVCVAGGLIFAGIAYYTVKASGAALTGSAAETKIKIAGPIEISTGSAVVALFILSVIFAAGVPSFVAWLNYQRGDDGPITLTGNFQPQVPNVVVASRDYGEREVLSFPIYPSQHHQFFKITPPGQYSAVDVEVFYVPLEKRFKIVLPQGTEEAPVVGDSAAIPDKIKLESAAIAGVETHNDASISVPRTALTRLDLSVADPAAIAGAPSATGEPK